MRERERERDREGEWTFVRSRKRKATRPGVSNFDKDRLPPTRFFVNNTNMQINKTGAVSFFFTNFPDDWDEQALWEMFLRWGKTVDVFIPKKRDKGGRRFGFVRFINVQNSKVLERELDQIWIGTYKLRVNLSKSNVMKGEVMYKNVSVTNKAELQSSTIIQGICYADSVKGNVRALKKCGDLNGSPRKTNM